MGVRGPYGINEYIPTVTYAAEDTPRDKWIKEQRSTLKEFCESVNGVYDDAKNTCAVDTRSGLLLISIDPRYYEDGSKVTKIRVLFRYDQYPATKLPRGVYPNKVYWAWAESYGVFTEDYSTDEEDYFCLSAFSGINTAKKDKDARTLSVCVSTDSSRDTREALIYLDKDGHQGARVYTPDGKPRTTVEVKI